MLLASCIVTAIVALGTFLPFLPIAHGFVRVGDFPRQQMLVAAIIVLAISIWSTDDGTAWHIVQAVMLATAIVQAWLIIEFTPFWKKQSKAYDPKRDQGEPVRLVASNVKMSKPELRRARRGDRLAGPGHRHPDGGRCRLGHRLSAFSPTTRMSSTSRRKTPTAWSSPRNSSCPTCPSSCLLTDGVPSIIATVLTKERRRFRLFSIHPEPPVPNDTTEGRDGETSLVALTVREREASGHRDGRPERRGMVGDDTALPPRLGPARSPHRPSDLLDLRCADPADPLAPRPSLPFGGVPACRHAAAEALRLRPFPVMFDLVLCSTAEAESLPDEASEDDIERAGELVDAAARRDDDPIGTDWEK